MTDAKDIGHRRAAKNIRSLSLRRLSVCVDLCLGAVVLSGVIRILIFDGVILNGYGKGKVERAFAEAYPGCELWIGKLDYSVGTNHLIAQFRNFKSMRESIK